MILTLGINTELLSDVVLEMAAMAFRTVLDLISVGDSLLRGLLTFSGAGDYNFEVGLVTQPHSRMRPSPSKITTGCSGSMSGIFSYRLPKVGHM